MLIKGKGYEFWLSGSKIKDFFADDIVGAINAGKKIEGFFKNRDISRTETVLFGKHFRIDLRKKKSVSVFCGNGGARHLAYAIKTCCISGLITSQYILKIKAFHNDLEQTIGYFDKDINDPGLKFSSYFPVVAMLKMDKGKKYFVVKTKELRFPVGVEVK